MTIRPLESRAQSGPFGHRARSCDRRCFARPAALGFHSALEHGPDRRPQADQCQVRVGLDNAITNWPAGVKQGTSLLLDSSSQHMAHSRVARSAINSLRYINSYRHNPFNPVAHGCRRRLSLSQYRSKRARMGL